MNHTGWLLAISMGKHWPQTSGPPQSPWNGSVPMHRPSEGWAGSGCAPRQGREARHGHRYHTYPHRAMSHALGSVAAAE